MSLFLWCPAESAACILPESTCSYTAVSSALGIPGPGVRLGAVTFARAWPTSSDASEVTWQNDIGEALGEIHSECGAQLGVDHPYHLVISTAVPVGDETLTYLLELDGEEIVTGKTRVGIATHEQLRERALQIARG